MRRTKSTSAGSASKAPAATLIQAMVEEEDGEAAASRLTSGPVTARTQPPTLTTGDNVDDSDRAVRMRLRSFARRQSEKADTSPKGGLQADTAARRTNPTASVTEEEGDGEDEEQEPTVTMEGALVDESAPPWDDEVVADDDDLHAAAAHSPEKTALSAVTEAAEPVADGPLTAQPASTSGEDGAVVEGEMAVAGNGSEIAPSTAAAQDTQSTQTAPATAATASTPAAAAAVADTSTALGNKTKKSRLGGNVEVTFTEEERERYKRLGMLSDGDGAQQEEAKPQVDSRSRIYQALNPQRLYQEQDSRGVTKVRQLVIGVGKRSFF